MNKYTYVVLTAMSLAALQFATVPAMAQDAANRQEQQIYGSHLMTEQERMEHRDRMRNASGEEERDRIRKEHHKEMQKRAAEHGITLPDEPPATRGHMMMPDGGGMGHGNR